MPNCSVPGCNSRGYEKDSISYHILPSDPAIRFDWLRQTGIVTNTTEDGKAIFVCSEHFCAEDYEQIWRGLC
jgi:hypothetical protein